MPLIFCLFSGSYLIKVFYDGQEVKESPFAVNVYDISYARIIRHVFGPINIREPYQFQGKYNLWILLNKVLLHAARSLKLMLCFNYEYSQI